MGALFRPESNTTFRIVLLAMLVLAAGTLIALMVYVRTPWNTSQFHAYDQPVMFDHRHHVIDDEIECLYCHSGAERSAYAGIPSTSLCMGCHAQIWNDSPMLETVRRSYFSGQPIRWRRVHRIPDFAFFNHAVHVSGRGIECARCHGAVEEMGRVYKVRSLQMGWCLDCHRDPDGTLAEPITPPSSMTEATRQQLTPPPIPASPHEITPLTTCTACHR